MSDPSTVPVSTGFLKWIGSSAVVVGLGGWFGNSHIEMGKKIAVLERADEDTNKRVDAAILDITTIKGDIKEILRAVGGEQRGSDRA